MRDYDEIFKALADPHRRRIVSALTRRPMVAGELAGLARLAPNAVSFHLKWLKSAGLVTAQREGRFLRYQVDAEALQDWQAHLKEQLALAPSRARAATTAPSPRSRAMLSAARPRAASPRVVSPPPAADEFSEALPTELL